VCLSACSTPGGLNVGPYAESGEGIDGKIGSTTWGQKKGEGMLGKQGTEYPPLCSLKNLHISSETINLLSPWYNF
jgi:hypothetical protein